MTADSTLHRDPARTVRYTAPEFLEGYDDTTYYGLPAIKPGHYRWLIVAYFFVGGLASAAQFLATVIDLVGRRVDRPLVRAGRYLALGGALVSPPLLIADLHTPQRWYNMVRIYRPTSAMSIGSWALSAFGIFSGFTAVGQAVEDLFKWKIGTWLARLASLPAALTGGVVAIYTGTLLAATNVPLWATGFPFLSSLFASSAASTASASLALLSPRASDSTHRRLNIFASIAGLTELLFALLVERGWRQNRVASPIHTARLGSAWYLGVFGLGILGPLAAHLFQIGARRETRGLDNLAALAALMGGFLLRTVFIFGGRASGKRPQDYLCFTRPDTKAGERLY